MKNNNYSWVFVWLVMTFFYSPVTAQEKVQQNVARLKVVENSKVLIDTTIYDSSQNSEKELNELLKEKDIFVFRSGESGEKIQSRNEHETTLFRWNEVDSMLHQLQQKVQDAKIQVLESEELNKVKEEMRVNWEKIRVEIDSIRGRILQRMDNVSPPQVYFWKGDDQSHEVVVIRKSKGADNEVVKEEKVIEKVFKKEIPDESGNTGARRFILQKDEENILEVEGIRIIMPCKNTVKIKKHDEGHYEIGSEDGKVVIIQVKKKNDVNSEPVNESKRKRKK